MKLKSGAKLIKKIYFAAKY